MTLKSGGPKMTVEKMVGGDYEGYGERCICVRIHEDGQTYREEFLKDLLKVLEY